MWECRLSSLEAADECVIVCVCVCVMVGREWGGWDRRTGLRRQDQHQYSGVALTLVVHGPKKIGQWNTKQPTSTQMTRPASWLKLSSTFSLRHHKKNLGFWLGAVRPPVLELKLKLWVHIIRIKVLCWIKNHLFSNASQEQKKSDISILTASSFFDIQLLQQQYFLIHINALT